MEYKLKAAYPISPPCVWRFTPCSTGYCEEFGNARAAIHAGQQNLKPKHMPSVATPNE